MQSYHPGINNNMIAGGGGSGGSAGGPRLSGNGPQNPFGHYPNNNG